LPTKPTTSGASTTGSQRDRRFLDTFHDQHKSARFPVGRPWCGYREYAANPELGHQPGFIDAQLTQGDHEDPFGSNWIAPWIPEFNGGRTSYYEYDYLRKKITIRYDHVFANDTLGFDRYYEAAAKIAGANGWGEIEYGVIPRYQVTALIGLPPRSPKIAQAAMAGDPWLLGFIEEPNAALAKLLGISTRGLTFKAPVPQAVVTPEQVLTLPPGDLAAMIAQAVAQAMAAQDATKQAANHARAARMRAGKKPKGQPVPQAAPEQGAA